MISSLAFRRCLAFRAIPLTPRFSEVQGRAYYDNRFSGLLIPWQKPLKRLWLPQVSFKTQLKQGVNEGVSRR
jgi:hypothetical protein